jgi:hypothetical protein
MPRSIIALALFVIAAADDPAGSWLSYASWTAPGDAEITMLNTTWVVPSMPTEKRGSNAPGWWFGLQTSKGNGALIQPILAYGYKGDVYSIFNACFDWTDGSWHTSPETYTVQPGDTITSSVYKSGDREFTMVISSKDTGKTITTPYTLQTRQTRKFHTILCATQVLGGVLRTLICVLCYVVAESTAYFVLEHQPRTCKAYPASGDCKFTDIYVEVGGKAATPTWTAAHVENACNSKATIVDAATIDFTWDTNADAPTMESLLNSTAPKKWLPASL